MSPPRGASRASASDPVGRPLPLSGRAIVTDSKGEPPVSEFLFVGATTEKEGATTQIKAGGGTYRKKLLSSNPENWAVIAEMITSGEVKAVLATLSGDNYRTILSGQYRAVADQMFAAFASIPNIIFVHESVFFGPSELSDEEVAERLAVEETFIDPWDDPEYIRWSMFPDVHAEVRERVNSLLSDHGLNVMPYKTNAERAVMATSFIEDNDRALLFRVYVPAGRLYADEADRLLDLFQEWLGATGRASIRRDGYKTGAGEVYEFFGSEPSASGELDRQFSDFSDFLDLCVRDSASANQRLEDAGVPSGQAVSLTTRYAREARRLSLDLRHAREDRIMQLAHTFENELLEEVDRDWKPVVEALIPPVSGLTQAIAPQVATFSPPPTIQAENVQIFTGAVSQVVQSVQGSVHLNPEPKQLLELIQQFGGAATAELSSAVHELEDEDARAPDRLTARQKLRAFLGAIATQVPPMAMQTLQKYLEQRIGLS